MTNFPDPRTLARMHWQLAISRNKSALLAIVASIVAMIDGREGGLLTRRLHNAALALLRPVESATRRLIVIAAHGVEATPPPSPAFPAELRKQAAKGTARVPAFRLVDPAKRYIFKRIAPPPRGVPRIRSLWGYSPQPPSPPPVKGAKPDLDAPMDACRLHLRLAALERALTDLPRQTKRLARWRARQAIQATKRNVLPKRPLRIGRPPGWRQNGDRTVDPVLAECHRLALDALAERPSRRDSS